MTKKSGNSLQAILNRASAPPAEATVSESPAPAANKRAPRARKAPEAAPARVGNPGRIGMKMIGGHFSQEISKQLRIIAAEEETTVQALLEEAIMDLLTKKGGGKVRR